MQQSTVSHFSFPFVVIQFLCRFSATAYFTKALSTRPCASQRVSVVGTSSQDGERRFARRDESTRCCE